MNTVPVPANNYAVSSLIFYRWLNEVAKCKKLPIGIFAVEKPELSLSCRVFQRPN